MSQSRNQKQQYWAEQLQRAEASGLSLIDYARLNNLSPAHLYQWRSTFKKQDTPKVTKTDEQHHFAQVVSTVEPNNTLTIQLGHANLVFGSLPDPSWIVALLEQAHNP